MNHDVPTLATEPLPVAAERLFRVPEALYRGMLARGLFGAEEVGLADGLLVQDEQLYRMPIEVYHDIANLGILGAAARVVLLDGLLVAKMGRNPPHVAVTQLTWQALARVVPAGWQVRKEDPLALPDGPTGRDSEPEPDLAIVRGEVSDYQERHPGPADVALIVEVADSSLREDRRGLSRYAWAGVPVVWIIDLNERVVAVHARPTRAVSGALYEDARLYDETAAVPVVIDGREVARIAVADLLTRQADRREARP